jgi:thiamine kinase-like enzyme
MVDTSGDAWLVDWDLAGYYPIYFEYAAMSNFLEPDSWGVKGRLRWWILQWLAAGQYHKQCKQLAVIRSKLQRFSVGRRLNVKAKLTAPSHLSLEKAPDSSDESVRA